MTRRFIVRPLAEADLEDAARWYEDERAGLVERFLSDVDHTFARIRERPLQFPTRRYGADELVSLSEIPMKWRGAGRLEWAGADTLASAGCSMTRELGVDIDWARTKPAEVSTPAGTVAT